MDFPAYVPHAVRTHVNALLSSDPREFSANRVLAMAEAQLADLVRAGVAAWRPDFIEAEARHKRAKDNLSCILRLALDVRMKDAYLLLAGQLTRDVQIVHFIASAISARDDYSQYRERVIEAKSVAIEVAAAAANLASALRKVENSTGPLWPEEFYSTHALLERARLDQRDGQYVPPPSVVPMRIDRGGVQTRLDPTQAPAAELDPEQYRAWKAEGRPEPQRETVFDPRNTRSVILALEAAARAYQPAETGVLHAALASRKGNSTAEYVRAFNWTLGDGKRTPAMIKAMAITATVVLNDPDHDVTPADVRSVIARKIVPTKRAHVRLRYGYLTE